VLGISAVTARKTIIISSDGFRWDYYGRTPTPGIDKIKSGGVHVKNLENAFTTDTFPNHFTLVTGLYEESHGIVDNEMYDPVFDETFDMSTTDPKWWQGGEPIWVTAGRAGKKSVCVNWVGCAIPIEGEYPTYWAPFDGTLPYNDRIDTVIDRLHNDDAELGLLYFEEPDHSCHMFGPDSQEVLDAIQRVDKAVSYLLSKVDLREVNIIFTSDHGGYSVSPDRTIVLDEYTDLEYSTPDGGAVAHVWPTNMEDVEKILRGFSRIDPTHATCYRKEHLPPKLHYRRNRRIGPIVCIAQLGWSITKSEQDKERWHLKGSHGYDPTLDESSPMRPLFMAHGPSFISQTESDPPLNPFRNVNIYPLLFTVLEIPSELMPNINGSTSAIDHLLHQPEVRIPVESVILQW
jgi:ectonucleotide pyrophosphatase/phosphodiesterase family member 5